VLDRAGQQEATLKSAQARYAAHAAQACGYEFSSLDGADGYLFEVRDGQRRALFAAGAGTPYALNDARAASIARDKAFTAQVLRRAGVSVLPGEMFFVTERWADMRQPGREPRDALAYAERAAYPVFCKPISASNGLYAEVIEGPDAFADYMTRVSREHFAILIQPVVRAPEHRVFVLDGKALFSYRKNLPRVVGDGVRPLAALIAARQLDDSAPASPRMAHDAKGVRLALDHVLQPGEPAWLAGPANRAAGGSAAVLTDGARPDLAHTAIAATDAVGLRLAAVDLFEAPSGAMVIEVNSNPMVATLEDHGRWDLITEIWRANFAAALK
jgi:glutathione synthase/RimK-type ligase-like ATP-grasp enzyme